MPKLTLTPHAKQRLKERFGMRELPEGKREPVISLSNNRRIWRVGNVYYLWNKSNHKIVTVLEESHVRRVLWKRTHSSSF